MLDEAITLLARRTTYAFAADRAAKWLASRSLTILRPDEQDESDTLQFFRKYADQHVSFTDCISFVLMGKLGLKSVFTFDRHFVLSGFQVEP